MLTIIDAGDSLAALGNTYSSYPWGTGDIGVPLLLKLPWEGIMRFHPDSKFDSLFLQPRVYLSSADPEFIIFSSIPIPGGAPQVFASISGTVPFTVNAAAIQPGSAMPGATTVTNYPTYAVEDVDPAVVQSYAAWAAYHLLSGPQADPYADPDDDGLSNYMEAYFGRNPWIAEIVPILSIVVTETNGVPTATIEVERSTFGRFLNVQLQSTESLTSWTNAITLSETVQPLDELKERVSIATRAMFRPGSFGRLDIRRAFRISGSCEPVAGFGENLCVHQNPPLLRSEKHDP